MDAVDRLQASVDHVAEAWKKSPYYEDAEKWTHIFWNEGTDFKTQFDRLDLSRSIELACGYGRHAEHAVKSTRDLMLMDIFDENLDFCKERLGKYKNVSFVKCSGSDFQPVENNSITSVYCYDAMVHFAPDVVRSYVSDTARILAHGGRALFHHSNYGLNPESLYGKNPHARNHMTRQLFADYATSSGLQVLYSEQRQWGGVPDLDCLTLLEKK
jgi:SAM-dependent methyltransferase